MASKRQRKKIEKKRQEKILSNQYSPKEIKKMVSSERAKETKRIERNISRQVSRERTRNYFRDLGFSDRFINQNRLYDKKVESYSKEDIRKLKRKAADLKRQEEKITALKNAGYTEYTKSDLRKGWEKLNEKFPGLEMPDNFVYTADEYLYIGAAEIQSGFRRENLSSFTMDDLVTQINDRIKEAANNPTGSGDAYCVFRISTGSYEKCQHIANVFYERGYNLNPDHMKLSSARYMKLTIDNKWSKREFMELVYNCTTQMLNEDVANFISDMKEYCRDNGLPFMKDID